MEFLQQLDPIAILSLGNLILSSAIVILSFSLLLYIFTHNFGNRVARAFCALLAFVTVVYAIDVVLAKVQSLEAAHFWLKFQWIGIAFVPAAYFHFAGALLRTTNASSRGRQLLIPISYALSAVLLSLALFTNWMVRGGLYLPWAVHFQAGPLFWLFAIYFFLASGWAAVDVLRARYRCLTSTSRRRMTYVMVSVFAPLSVFPYLPVQSFFGQLSSNPMLFLVVEAAANVAIALMIVIMTYSVAYHGVLTPDRVVRSSLIRYLIQGPLLGTCVIGLILVVPENEQILGLPRDTVLIFATVVGIAVFQILLALIDPLIDWVAHRGDRAEASWFRRLDERLLTSTDLEQLLEDILTAICDLLRVETGFVVVMGDGQLRIDTSCGSRRAASEFVESCELSTVATINDVDEDVSVERGFVPQDGFWLRPLRTQDGEATLGILGVEQPAQVHLSQEEGELIEVLVDRAALALEDRRLQQGVFGVLKQITPEIESLQRWRGAGRYADAPTLQAIEDNPIYSPELSEWVKNALSSYWGGPELTESPLLRLRIVREALAKNGYNGARAMRSVLGRAINSLRPEGERSLTAREWLLYNILEMRFIEGLRVRDIAPRLAISESDLYRKQRVAVEEVAKALVNLEERNGEPAENDETQVGEEGGTSHNVEG